MMAKYKFLRRRCKYCPGEPGRVAVRNVPFRGPLDVHIEHCQHCNGTGYIRVPREAR